MKRLLLSMKDFALRITNANTPSGPIYSSHNCLNPRTQCAQAIREKFTNNADIVDFCVVLRLENEC